MERFANVSWRKQRVQQLQFNGNNTVVKVTHPDTHEFLSLSLNAFSKSEDFEFKLDSNIQFVFKQRELFGLMTRNSKENFMLKQATLQQATESLIHFLNQDQKALEQILLESKQVSVKEAS